MSIHEVVKTLAEAMVLVFLVVFLFLQNWRATLIPFAAVPVSLIGTFAGLLLLGYSINTLTLFGMVLAIGIVVDDAIVVLENVERIMHEEQLSAREAAIKAMHEVTSPIIAIVLVLCAVFVPIAFLGGLTGELYRQFAVTISIAVVDLGHRRADAHAGLCVLILKREHKEPGALLPAFNRGFARVTDRYADGVGVDDAARRHRRWCCSPAWWRWPPACGASRRARLVPDEDQGFYIAAVILPDGAIAAAHRQGGARGRRGHQVQPRQRGRRRVHRLRLPRRRLPQQRGHDLRHAEALGRAQGSRCRQLVGEFFMKTGAHQGRPGARLQPAADLRPRHRRRLRVLHPEPRRGRRQAPGAR